MDNGKDEKAEEFIRLCLNCVKHDDVKEFLTSSKAAEYLDDRLCWRNILMLIWNLLKSRLHKKGDDSDIREKYLIGENARLGRSSLKNSLIKVVQHLLRNSTADDYSALKCFTDKDDIFRVVALSTSEPTVLLYIILSLPKECAPRAVRGSFSLRLKALNSFHPFLLEYLDPNRVEAQDEKFAHYFCSFLDEYSVLLDTGTWDVCFRTILRCAAKVPLLNWPYMKCLERYLKSSPRQAHKKIDGDSSVLLNILIQNINEKPYESIYLKVACLLVEQWGDNSIGIAFFEHLSTEKAELYRASENESLMIRFMLACYAEDVELFGTAANGIFSILSGKKLEHSGILLAALQYAIESHSSRLFFEAYAKRYYTDVDLARLVVDHKWIAFCRHSLFAPKCCRFRKIIHLVFDNPSLLSRCVKAGLFLWMIKEPNAPSLRCCGLHLFVNGMAYLEDDFRDYLKIINRLDACAFREIEQRNALPLFKNHLQDIPDAVIFKIFNQKTGWRMDRLLVDELCCKDYKRFKALMMSKDCPFGILEDFWSSVQLSVEKNDDLMTRIQKYSISGKFDPADCIMFLLDQSIEIEAKEKYLQFFRKRSAIFSEFHINCSACAGLTDSPLELYLGVKLAVESEFHRDFCMYPCRADPTVPELVDLPPAVFMHHPHYAFRLVISLVGGEPSTKQPSKEWLEILYLHLKAIFNQKMKNLADCTLNSSSYY